MYSRIKRSFLSMDLKKKLLIFSLSYISIMMVLVFILYTTRTARTIYDRNAENAYYEVFMESEALRTRIILAEEISNQIYNHNALNKSLLDRYSNIGDSAEVYVEMLYPTINNNLFAKSEVIDQISIYIQNDTFMINGQEIKYATAEVISADWYQKVVEEGERGQILWGYEPDDEGRYNLVLYRNLNGYLGISSGVLKMSVKQGYVREVNDNTSLHTILQIRENMNLALDVIDGQDEELIVLCIEAIGASRDGYHEFEFNSQDYLAAYQSFATGNSQYTWKSILTMPTDVLFADVNRQNWIAFFVVLLATLIGSVIIVLFANSFTRRIHVLDEKANLVSQGNFDVRLDIGGLDEIGRLSVSINKMLDYIDNLINQVYENKIKMQTYQIKQNESEFKALQNQINPHFLYNTLDAMRYKATLAGNRELGNMMISLSRLLSYSVNQKGSEVRLWEELEHLDNYLLLVKVRFEDRIDFDIEVDAALHEAMINKLTLQPIVENSIQHGFRSQGQVLHIRVSAEAEGGMLVIRVRDNGRGIDARTLEQLNNHNYREQNNAGRSHVGLDNVHNRIRLFFGDDYGIRVMSREGEGTEVLVTLPYREYDDEV